MKHLCTLLVAVTLLLAGIPLHADSPCNNTLIGQVNAKVEYGGKTRRCGVGIGLLGIEISFSGPECPDRKFIYPSHQECLGFATGSHCEYDSNMPVEEEKCSCTFVGLIGTGIHIPTCDCTSVGDAGHIQDMKGGPCQ